MATVNKPEPVVAVEEKKDTAKEDMAKKAEAASKEHEQQNKRRLEEKKQAIEERHKKRDEMLVQIQDTLFQHNGLESNIPVNNGYWDLLNAFRAINKEDDAEFVREMEAKNA